METSPKETHPIYLAIFSIMVVGTVIVTGLFDDCPNACSSWLEVVEVGTPRGIIHGTFIVSVIEVIRIMIILPSDYLRYKFIEPLKQSLKDEGEAIGIAKGEAQGRTEMRAEILEWLRDKEEAEREGRPFDEPMPGAERNGSEPKG